MQASLAASSRGYSSEVGGLLISVASLAAEHRLWGAWVPVVAVQGMWNLPEPGTAPASPVLAGTLSNPWAAREALLIVFLS